MPWAVQPAGGKHNDAGGELVWSRSLEQLLPADRRTQIAQSISSRYWLRPPGRTGP